MSGAIAHDHAQRLRAALDGVFQELADTPDVSDSAREAFLRLVDVLESNNEAVVLAADTLISTQQAADLLGISRMTVVRLIDRGDLTAEGEVHRRIRASELARYRDVSSRKRRAALQELVARI